MARQTICETCQKPLGNPECPACRRYSPAADPVQPSRPEPVVPGSGPVQRERRQPHAARTLIGGERASDPPLTTRACADWMGVTTEFIRGAIADRELKAEDVTINGRRVLRVHLDDFIDYLQRIGWKRLPRAPRRPGEPT